MSMIFSLSESEKDLIERIYIDYKNLMYYVAYEILQNPQKAEDAVHDSFVKIIGKKNKLNELLCPQIKSLCVIVCRNTALNMLRDERKFFDVTEEFIEEIPHSQNLEDIVENQIEEDAIVKKILSLPTTYRDVLYLYYEFEYKVKEGSRPQGTP